jgi:Tol biopolymer transport system component
LLVAFTGTTATTATTASATAASAAQHAPHVERVSTAADGSQADGPSGDAAISADGRDLDTGALEKAAGHATAPSLAADGRKVAYQKGRDSYVRDLDAGTTTRVRGTQPSLAGNGTALAYTSGRSVHLLELATGKRQLVSVDRWGGRNDLAAGHPSVNADGTVVAFESASPDLVEGDTNGVSDVFLRTVR